MADPAEPSPTALRAVLDVLATANRPMGLLRDGVVVAVNPAFARLFGTDAVAPPGRALLDLIAPASLELVAELARRQSAGEELPASVCITGLTADAAELPLQLDATSVVIDGQPHALLLAARAGRRLGRRELRDSERGHLSRAVRGQYRRQVADRAETGRIVDANLAAAEFYGWPLESLRTMRITDLNMLTPEEVQAEMENARSGRRRYSPSVTAPLRRVQHVEVHSGSGGDPGRDMLFSIVHDVTERDVLEEQLRAVPADRSDRSARRRDRARLQQPADRDDEHVNRSALAKPGGGSRYGSTWMTSRHAAIALPS